jgi:hypothetical protein
MPTRDALTTVRRLAPRSVGSMEFADTIESDNFVSSTSTSSQAGWQITRAGVAHFTEGFLGNLNVSGTLSLTSGGSLRTSTSTGEIRWVFSGSTAAGVSDQLQGYMGGVQNDPARLKLGRFTGGLQRGPRLTMSAGTVDSSTGREFSPTQIVMESASEKVSVGNFITGTFSIQVGTSSGGSATLLHIDPELAGKWNTPIQLWANGSLQTMSVGSTGSGGTGYRALRVPD